MVSYCNLTSHEWELDMRSLPTFPRCSTNIAILICSLLGSARAQTITTVTNGASFVPGEIAPGSISTIFGTNLSSGTAQATGTSWPTSLGGLTVFVNGVAVPLNHVSPTQITFQAPNNALGGQPTKWDSLNISYQGGAGPFTAFTASASAPGIFAGPNGWAIIQNQDLGINAADNPAAAGSYVTVNLTGIGAVDNPVAEGTSTPDSPRSRATAPVTATIGGVNAKVAFAGLRPGYVGLAQASIQIPNMPPGAYPLTITVGSAVSNSAMIAVSGGTVSPQYLLTSIAGEGVSGSPSTGSSSNAPGTTMPYSYAPMNGYAAAVEVDGTLSPLSGAVTTDADHWVWAFGQPLIGTDFPGYITAPNDPTVIPYPQFYGNRPSSQTVRVANPYCALQSNVIAYQRSFLGSFPMPAVTGAPLPGSIQRGVQLKDFWNPPGFGSVTGNSGCATNLNDMRTALTGSVARAKTLGADHVTIVTNAHVVDLTAQPVVIDPSVSGQGISEPDLAFIGGATTAAGLDLWLDVQICCVAGQQPTQQQFSAFLDAYTQFIVQEAQLAQKYGVKSMMLNWNAWYIDVTPFGGLYPTKMTAALAQVRSVFQGKVRLSDGGVGIQDPSSSQFAALYNSVDAIQIENRTSILTADEDTNLTFPLIKQKYKDMFAQMAQRFVAFPAQNFNLLVLIQSHRNFLETGWIEDSFCANGCIQETLETDFSVQAMAYEALLEATVESGLNFVSFDAGGYWYVDVMLPQDSFPNMAHSIRNKPAEAIVQRWFRQ
jgi:uncharacterized protein (TIGR03437 family)